MPIYVDNLCAHAHGRVWCHLSPIPVTPENLIELHRIAKKIGLLSKWFQPCPPASWPHYDIVVQKVPAATQAGAIYIDNRTQAMMMQKAREDAKKDT
jgi:hypothetical protein